jgi:hypothetical protein
MGSGAHQVQLTQSESELLPGWILCVQGAVCGGCHWCDYRHYPPHGRIFSRLESAGDDLHRSELPTNPGRSLFLRLAAA